MTRNAASQAQVDAAHPMTSTWLSANAGSGKTRVLTDRVARLLLEDVDPQNILCLTYTKAAASEMQTRLFKSLGAWSIMSEAELSDELNRLEGGTGMRGQDSLNRARSLFARALETPGGLKVQTIHAFCERLLKRFPLEAGITPGTDPIDESDAGALYERSTHAGYPSTLDGRYISGHAKTAWTRRKYPGVNGSGDGGLGILQSTS